MKKYAVILVLVALVAAGCAQKSATKPEDQQQTQQTDADKQKKDGADTVTDKQITGKVDSVDSSDAASRKMVDLQGILKDIYFDFDKYDVKESFQPALKSISTWMTNNPGVQLSIEGHCDERGTNEYNLALGDRRAKSVRDALAALGVASSRMETISYGEEKPVCAEHTEDCWAKNRRVHFVGLAKAGK